MRRDIDIALRLVKTATVLGGGLILTGTNLMACFQPPPTLPPPQFLLLFWTLALTIAH
ncbi:MAG: hypothetical protein LAO30_24910 [Acidobacteriia bacterium]|nr:hypothetical protein [Terriglobia bacterium]